MTGIDDRRFTFFSAAVQRRLLLYAIIAVPFIVHSSPFILQRWNFDHPWIHNVRSILFLSAVLPLVFIVGKAVFESVTVERSLWIFNRSVTRSFAVVFVLALLVVPTSLGIMGAGYALMSGDPFSFVDHSGQLYQRLLLPATAYAFGFRGPEMFHLFSLLMTVLFLVMLTIYFERQGIKLSLIDMISIGTSSFLITQLQSPGYTEPLAFVFLLLAVTVRGDEVFRASAVTLAVLSHESIILSAAAAAIVFHTRRDLYWIAAIGGVYALVWLFSFGFDVAEVLRVRSVGGRSTAEWIVEYPYRELLGLFFSMKLLWLFVFFAWLRLPQERRNIAVLLIPGILLTLLAVDTSRMAGFGFLALLYSIVIIKQHRLLSEKRFAAITLFNLCIPAVYVGLNSGIVYFDGLYQWLLYGIFLR